MKIELHPTPPAITPLQARKALRQSGLYALVTDFLEEADEEIQESWNYATEIRRDSPVLAAFWAELGLPESDLDELFRLAGTL